MKVLCWIASLRHGDNYILHVHQVKGRGEMWSRPSFVIIQKRLRIQSCLWHSELNEKVNRWKMYATIISYMRSKGMVWCTPSFWWHNWFYKQLQVLANVAHECISTNAPPLWIKVIMGALEKKRALKIGGYHNSFELDFHLLIHDRGQISF